MSHRDTSYKEGRFGWAAAVLLCVVAAAPLAAQAERAPEWRPVGNTLRLMGLPSPAGGPVERLWFSADGRLHLLLGGGRPFATSDWETWTPVSAPAPAPLASAPAGRLEQGAPMLRSTSASGWTYAAAAHLYRSSDGGRSWENLTEWQGESLLGGAVLDFAVDPGQDGRIAVATRTGVWLTQDAGLTWVGLNEGLPNLPVRRFESLPEGGAHLRVAVASGESTELLEWVPGQRAGWVALTGPDPESGERARAESRLGVPVTAAGSVGAVLYAGAADGRLFASMDGGVDWRAFDAQGGRAERFWINLDDPQIALVALSGPGGGRVLRTLNGGVWWDELTADLAAAAVYGLAADVETGAVYAATDAGLFWTLSDLRAPAPATAWTRLEGLPAGAAVRDAALDRADVRLFAAVDGYGIWVAPAPHRAARPRAVHTADFGMRAAAPGALLSVVGAEAVEASAAGRPAVVLAAAEGETQLQIPFDVTGDLLRLSLPAAAAAWSVDLPLRAAAPAILADRDGAPVLLEAESGMPLDAANPGRPGMTVQILATGLGRVDPDWPAGMAAPLEAPPSVRARVRVLLDGQALPVLSATLAPGYIGYYLVEVLLPEFVDSGLARLALEADGNLSPSVTVHLDQ